jgi:hypothetical protein
MYDPHVNPDTLYRLPEGRTKLKCHDVRHLTQCPSCKCLGDRRMTIKYRREMWHPQCLYEHKGIDFMLGLPSADRAKVCISDMPANDMRKFIDKPL